MDQESLIADISSATPLMQQYYAIKHQFSDALILFQVGDFYELFFDDAKKASAFLGIALTKRGHVNGQPIPLCGVPVHALDHYLSKLVKGGFKVAICDQLEPAVAGKVVDRGVTRVLTPGTLTDDKLLDAKSASYLFSFFPTHNQWGLIFGELLTAQLFATALPINAHKMLDSELTRFFPDEILVPDNQMGKQFQAYFKQQSYFTTLVPDLCDDEYMNGAVRGWMGRQFKKETLSTISSTAGLREALYSLYGYLKRNQESALEQFSSINFYKPEDFLILDAATQKNLDLVVGYDGSKTNSLFEYMDRATTSMGSRTIKKWIMRPSIKKETIEQRYDVIELLIKDIRTIYEYERLLQTVGDVERIVGRIALKRATLHDYIALSRALAIMPEIKNKLNSHQVSLIAAIAARIEYFYELSDLLGRSINEDSTQDSIIKEGFDKNLDRLRKLAHNSHEKIVELELREQQKTGIQSLKVRYNQVHGYYFEITKANLDSVPDYFVRQQTLVGRERFTTPELKILQSEIINARNELSALESAVFERIKSEVYNHLAALRHTSAALAHLDALLSLSKIAYEDHCVRPAFNDQRNIIITQGRHPMVARNMQHHFIPNNTSLTDEQSLWIITGPNMGGKSTYLRQNALICILAQCGSFVPAQSASLPILDRIFTRIGAGDNVAAGKSTFLIEMEETALICTQATKNSLVILDEVGRGTSTFDGLAIAQAVVEFIYNSIGARCLFATHYHELTHLSDSCAGILSYYTASKKTEDGILFLYKITQGTADGSFGIEVAQLAGLPQEVVVRARHILQALPENPKIEYKEKEVKNSDAHFFSDIQHIDLDAMSPRQAYEFLWNLKQKVFNQKKQDA